MSEDDDSKAVFVHSFTLVATVAAAALYGYVLARVPKAMPGMSETYRQRCHTYVSTSVMGSVLEAVMAMFSIGSCVTFVWETYIDGPVRACQCVVIALLCLWWKRCWPLVCACVTDLDTPLADADLDVLCRDDVLGVLHLPIRAGAVCGAVTMPVCLQPAPHRGQSDGRPSAHPVFFRHIHIDRR